jgi:hypothetical protein
LTIVGYVILLVAKRASVCYGGTFFVATGVYLGSPMVNKILTMLEIVGPH